MHILSAYAPPTFSQPTFVWMTCECDLSAPGSHMLGCWVDSLNVDHAWKVLGQALADAHEGSNHWFLIGDFPSFFSAAEVHVKMAADMQNGRSNELWEQGYEPYLRFWDQFQDAPPYKTEL